MVLRQLWWSQHQVVRIVTLASIAVISVTIFLYLYKFHGDITGFFRIGSVLPLSPYLRDQHVLVHQGEIGYDGQQFLSIALDPWLQNQGSIEALDSPRYRYRRIFYPLLSYLLGFGNAHVIPYVLVGVNCLCIILLVLFIALDMHRCNQQVWQSLLLLLVPGIWIILSFSTADLLSSLLLAIAIYCYRSNRNIYTSISLCLACLTRETMLLIWLGFLLTSIWERKRKQMLHLFWAGIPSVVWNIYVLSRFLSQGTAGIKENFGTPLAGILDKLHTLTTNSLGTKNLFEAYSFALLIVMFVAIISATRQRFKDNRVIIVSAIAYSLIFALASIKILGYFLDYSRVFTDVYILLLLSLTSRPEIKTLPMALCSVMTITFLLAHS